jgi:hypothetical protein
LTWFHSYTAIDPSLIKAGDVVEIAFVCVGVPVREKRYRMLLSLRAVTLISDQFRKVNCFTMFARLFRH